MNIFEKFLFIKTAQMAYGNKVISPICAIDFQANVSEIREEWMNFVCNAKKHHQPIDDVSDEQKHLNLDKKWKAYFLYGYEFYNDLNKIYFPVTLSLIKKWEKEITIVMFSTLEPGKHIQPHKGRNFGVIRTQLGIDIKVPDETGLRVNGEVFILKEMELLTFDDTLEHEAWNYSLSDRTVLIIDTKKKLPLIYSIINYFFQRKIGKSDYILNTIDKIKKQTN